jgi:ELWxxDGT repeat protein
MVKDIRAGSTGSDPQDFHATDALLFFRAYSGSPLTCYVSDGTEAGTFPLGAFGTFTNFARVGNQVVFGAVGATDVGAELWKSDGTVAGTALLKDIYPPSSYESSLPETLFSTSAGLVYFSATTRFLNEGRELYKTDGTTAGTIMVKDIWTGGGDSKPQYFLETPNGKIFFLAEDGTTGRELWISDGTESGTNRISDIKAGSGGSIFDQPVATNTYVFMYADDGVNGSEPWIYPYNRPCSVGSWTSYK